MDKEITRGWEADAKALESSGEVNSTYLAHFHHSSKHSTLSQKKVAMKNTYIHTPVGMRNKGSADSLTELGCIN